MSDPSRRCSLPTSPASPAATSSPDSADGTSLSSSPDGRQIGLFGPAPAPASRSRRPASARVTGIPAISGPRGFGSSASAALQSSLANRLRAATDWPGMTTFALTWRRRVTPSGRRILQLRAPVPLRYANGFSSWPAPTAALANKGVRSETGAIAEALRAKGPDLAAAASLLTWAAPQATDWKGSSRQGQRHGQLSEQTKALLGWTAPQAHDARGGSARRLENKRRRNLMDECYRLGTPSASSNAPTPTHEQASAAGGPFRLNPLFSLWLQGYPAEWASCAERAIASCRRSRRASSGQRGE